MQLATAVSRQRTLLPLLVAMGLCLSLPLAAQVDAPAEAPELSPLFDQSLTPHPALGLQPEPGVRAAARFATVSGGVQPDGRERTDAMLNGALIGLGALGILDNVVVHWILGWHRAIEDHPHTLEIEIGIVVVSTAMLVTGIVRERRARAQ